MDLRHKDYEFKAEVSEPTDEQLELINHRFALRPLTRDALYVRKIRLANDLYDRTFERFPREYLERFAETLPGKPLLAHHDRMQFPLGRFFDARVVLGAVPSEMADGDRKRAHWLDAWFYMPKLAGNEEVREQIDAGVYSHASIGFRWADLTCDICGKSYFRSDCPHIVGNEYEGQICRLTYSGDLRQVEAVEGSLVYLGAQYGAAVSKVVGRAAEKAALREWAAGTKQNEDVSVEVFPFRRLPIADRDREWDADAAEARVRRWAEATDGPNERYAQAFLARRGDPENFTSYILGYADVVDDELQLIPRGVFAVAAVLQGARGGVALPDAAIRQLRGIVSRHYARMREAFNDEELVPPWEQDGADTFRLPDSLTFEQETLQALAAVQGVVKRAQAVQHLRAAEGRTLSQERRQQIEALRDELTALLEATARHVPPERLLAVRAEFVRLQSRQLLRNPWR